MEPEVTTPAQDSARVLETVTRAGHLLLENGAEISRVEDTMKRIASHFGVTDEEFFVLSNGIFTTGGNHNGNRLYANVRYIPVKATRMDRIIAINNLSREITEGKYTLDEVDAQLTIIGSMPLKKNWLRIFASGAGAAGFCIMFGGSLFDSLAAFLAGFLLYVFVVYVFEPYLSKITGNLIGGGLVTITCILLSRLGIGNDMNHMIIGAIIPLVPGVAMTYGVRDIAHGDYLSGAVRLLDAVLVFLCIAVGVGTVFSLYRFLLGGIMP